jgi:hypothetical protein
MPRDRAKEPDATEIGMNREAELRIIRTAYEAVLAAVRVDDGSSRRAAPSAAKHARRRGRLWLHGQLASRIDRDAL